MHRAHTFFGRKAASHKLQLRAAGGAGQWLGVEAAIPRRLVLRAAGIAQREIFHGRIGPVIGHGGDDGIARPALGAVDEGVIETVLCGRCEFFDAVIAGEEIGRDVDFRRGGGITGQDFKSGESLRLYRFRSGELRFRQRRRCTDEHVLQLVQAFEPAFGMDEDLAGTVQHGAVDAQFMRGAINEGAVADSLHPPGYDDVARSGFQGSPRPGCSCRSALCVRFMTFGRKAASYSC